MMHPAFPLIASVFLVSAAQAETRGQEPSGVDKVAPALGRATQRLSDEVWSRSGLSRRDRSLVTLAILIARGQTAGLPSRVSVALDDGVKPAEISEIVTHLAFYAGWGSADAAVPAIGEVFARRGIGPDQLPKVSPDRLPLDEAAEAARTTRIAESFGAISPGLVADTTNMLFRDLWLRPDLAPRDRSLVTISALIANGQSAQLASHMTLGMKNGLTKAEIGEVISHGAFYAGWPNAFSAAAVAKSVFDTPAR